MQSPVKVWRNQKSIAGLLGKTGTVVAFTLIRVPPGGFSDQAPYPVVVVELEGSKRITAQLVDWQEADLQIGKKVITIVRRSTQPSTEGIIPYGIKVKPL